MRCFVLCLVLTVVACDAKPEPEPEPTQDQARQALILEERSLNAQLSSASEDERPAIQASLSIVTAKLDDEEARWAKTSEKLKAVKAPAKPAKPLALWQSLHRPERFEIFQRLSPLLCHRT